jgi:hypothetical protein
MLAASFALFLSLMLRLMHLCRLAAMRRFKQKCLEDSNK